MYCSYLIQSLHCLLLGVTRAPLQLAWDFSTASEACLTDRLLYVRNDAFKRIGDDGKYRVVRVENNYSKDIYRFLKCTWKSLMIVDACALWGDQKAMVFLKSYNLPNYIADSLGNWPHQPFSSSFNERP